MFLNKRAIIVSLVLFTVVALAYSYQIYSMLNEGRIVPSEMKYGFCITLFLLLAAVLNFLKYKNMQKKKGKQTD
ncbi:hypothetical protein QTN47_23320 [Danxiaibacter flavus]|uniref:Uncharacterized protein n=1 Tax=Danxiaibacter flavus TaxID=3049108 RepID=A0ABV3ZKP2_9BACT|nr:hypothetical protein QNM32_23325 [Chitinophagaceae bacterium DXS]